MEFDSTIKREKVTSEVCVVYDKKDGRIVHVHEFIGDGTGIYGPKGREERTRLTLESAKRLPNVPKQLAALHVESGFRWEPKTVYKVDAAKGKLVSQRASKVASKPPSGRAKK